MYHGSRRHDGSPPVVVDSGASSGLGRATAHAFARRGAAVVLAARRAEMLEEAAAECERLGAPAEEVVGGAGKVATVLKPLLGPLGTRVAGHAMNRGFLADEPRPPTTGALFEPMPDGMRVAGGWRKGPNNGGVPSATAVIAAGVALSLGLLAWNRRR